MIARYDELESKMETAQAVQGRLLDAVVRGLLDERRLQKAVT